VAIFIQMNIGLFATTLATELNFALATKIIVIAKYVFYGE